MNTPAAGIGRYAADLPQVDGFVTLGEGDTPVVPLDRLGRELGVRVRAKMETANPTGSYKDRVAAMSMSLAVSRHCRGWVATSSGNAGLAMAAYGARAGLSGFLCMVASAPQAKMLPLLPYGIGLVAVDRIGEGASRNAGAQLRERVREAAQRHDLYLGITAHAFNPDGMRGVDTIGYELAEQAPDTTCVYVPTGGGGLAVAVARGLAARNVPARVVTCQPTGCAPIVGHLRGEIAMPVVEHCRSHISALQLPNPPDGAAASHAVRSSGGWGTSVTDEEILAAQRRLAATEGVLVEPAAAAGLAALIADLEQGRVTADDQALLVLTGAGWKDLHQFTVDNASPPVVDIADVDHRIDDWARTLAGNDGATWQRGQDMRRA